MITMYDAMTLSLAFAALSMVGFGCVDVIAFLLSRQVNPRIVPLWTTTLSVIFLGIGLFFFPFPSLSITNMILLIAGSAIGVIALIAFYKGLNLGKISVVVPIANVWPLIAVPISIFVLHESLNLDEAIGIFLAIIGTALVSLKYDDVIKLKFNKLAAGAKFALITMVGWGVFYTAVGFLSQSLGWFWSTELAQIGVCIFMLFYLISTKTGIGFPMQAKGKFVLFGILLAVSFISYSISTNLGYVAITAPITGSSPLVTVLLGMFLLKERVEKSQFAGILLIVVGIALITL